MSLGGLVVNDVWNVRKHLRSSYQLPHTLALCVNEFPFNGHSHSLSFVSSPMCPCVFSPSQWCFPPHCLSAFSSPLISALLSRPQRYPVVHVIRLSFVHYFVVVLITDAVTDRPGMLVKNLWDEKLISLLKLDNPMNKKIVDPVPTTYEDVCEWATVAGNSTVVDRTHPYFVLYKCPSESLLSTVYPVTVQLQGFLGTHDLSLFSNWDGFDSCIVYLFRSDLTYH